LKRDWKVTYVEEVEESVWMGKDNRTFEHENCHITVGISFLASHRRTYEYSDAAPKMRGLPTLLFVGV
jgi:hypothetical protein